MYSLILFYAINASVVPSASKIIAVFDFVNQSIFMILAKTMENLQF